MGDTRAGRMRRRRQFAEHNNPAIVFARMPDKTALPSVPGAPRIRPARDGGALELEWSVPEHTGESPITHYTLRHWSPTERPPVCRLHSESGDADCRRRHL